MNKSLSLFLFVWLASVALFAFANAAPTNVHIIAHTHDDVGWLKTVDQYYIGSNEDIQTAGVQYILDSVIPALQANPDRKFIYVEIAFFMRWWREQTNTTKDALTALVQNGQFEFINGGWCMNDEATADYEDVIRQMTEGHQFLLQEFGVTPTVGWQIDPFGHSSTQAALFAQMGFSSLFFARIDFQDYNARFKDHGLEYVWRGSRSLGQETDIFTHAFWGTTYCWASGTDYEDGDAPVQDDPRLFDVNVKQLADSFAKDMDARAQVYRTPEILVTFGCDFGFQNANINFKNMDKLMAYINSNPSYNLNVMYSTPSLYAKAVNALNYTWDLKTDDLFPYADGPNSFWTGYFTSRSALKGYVRQSSAYLSAADILFSAWGLNTNQTAISSLDVLRQAQSVAQHHDAVSGTEKQAVAYDYAERISIGIDAVNDVVSNTLGNLVSNGAAEAPAFSFCPLLNESICPSTTQLSSGDVLPIVLFNSLGWQRTEVVRLPVSSTQYKVTDSNNNDVPYDILANPDTTHYTVVFQADLPPVGYNTYYLTATSSAKTAVPLANSDYIENEYYQVNFAADGRTASILVKSTGLTIPVTQDILYYRSNPGDSISSQASGAYIFRPDSSENTYPVATTVNLTISSSGDIVQEARQVWADWATQTIRLYANSSYIEIIDTIGPIPISDGNGKEVITRFSTYLKTNSTFYTDAQGHEFQTRVRNYRPTWNFTTIEPVAGNYFPVNEAIYMQDDQTAFALVNDRSAGGSSLEDGQLELMLHRRTLVDDQRGVGEPLNESTIVRTTKNLVINTLPLADTQVRTRSLMLNHPAIVAFGPVGQVFANPSGSAVSAPFPDNVHLQSLETQASGKILVRVHHPYATDEASSLAEPVSFDLNQLLSNINISSWAETQITGVILITDVERLKWTVNDGMSQENLNRKPTPEDDLIVLLNPMETKTFYLVN